MTDVQQFIQMSEELCGIPSFYLSGTGYAPLYYKTAVEAAGDSRVNRLLNLYQSLPKCCRRHRDTALRAKLLADQELGPVARNIIKLWYIATWLEMPQEWHAQFLPGTTTAHSFPPYAYAESLLGPAVRASRRTSQRAINRGPRRRHHFLSPQTTCRTIAVLLRDQLVGFEYFSALKGINYVNNYSVC